MPCPVQRLTLYIPQQTHEPLNEQPASQPAKLEPHMKRFRFGEITTDSIDMASLLMLLSRGSGSCGGGEERPESNPGGSLQPRVFECKTCSRRFPSFQALGGHRASHKKPRPDDSDREDDGRGGGAGKPPRVHECSVCGLEFAIGQALGGHMRRHRATVPEGGFGLELELAPPSVERKVKAARGQESRRRVGCLDLNLPPLEEKEDVDCRNIVVDKIHMVDCFH